MRGDRLRWDRRYRNAPPPERICPLLHDQLPPGQGQAALDLAAGTGANSQFLATQGYRVYSLDISSAAIERLKKCSHPGIQPIQVDLDHYRPPAKRFALVLNVRFLDRRLFPYLAEALLPEGRLIIQTLLADPKNDCPQVTDNKDHLLRPNELLHVFSALRILYYKEQFENAECLASMVAVRP